MYSRGYAVIGGKRHAGSIVSVCRVHAARCLQATRPRLATIVLIRDSYVVIDLDRQTNHPNHTSTEGAVAQNIGVVGYRGEAAASSARCCPPHLGISPPHHAQTAAVYAPPTSYTRGCAWLVVAIVQTFNTVYTKRQPRPRAAKPERPSSGRDQPLTPRIRPFPSTSPPLR